AACLLRSAGGAAAPAVRLPGPPSRSPIGPPISAPPTPAPTIAPGPPPAAAAIPAPAAIPTTAPSTAFGFSWYSFIIVEQELERIMSTMRGARLVAVRRRIGGPPQGS